ncbi:MAG: response regulator, partial [Anaerolineae bacterium]
MIRVVVVDDSAEIVSNIERMLYFEPDIEVIGTANDGETGLQLVRETKPDVVLLDINMPGMDGLTTAQAITSTIPGTQVIMMSVQDDLDYLRRAMLAGARDYILKPLDIDEVSNKVRQVHGLNRGKTTKATADEPEQRGRIVTVFGPRGGCGCSTVAVNLALALREFTKRKVVIVDASLQFGDVAVLLNLHDGRSIADLARRVDEVDANFAAEMTLPHLSGVRALLAPPRPEGAELVTGEAMHRILDALRQAFDFVVVDGGHAVNDATLASIDETDELLLMTTPDIPSIKSVRLMLEVLDALDVPEGKRKLVISQ